MKNCGNCIYRTARDGFMKCSAPTEMDGAPVAPSFTCKDWRGNAMVRVGDEVTKRINMYCMSSGFKGIENSNLHKGKVIYVHPSGRWYTAEFKVGNEAIRECFWTVELNQMRRAK